MSSEEKSAWIMLVVTGVAYATYLAIILGRADGTSLAEVFEYTGQSFVVIGGVAVLIMAMADVDYVAYRRGFQPW